MKTCNKCHQELPETSFHKRTYRTGKVGLQPSCKQCAHKGRKKYYKPHEYMRRKFSLTEQEYSELMEVQTCEVCGSDFGDKKCIDHCHKTEKIRGVLCHKCNTALGLVNDDPRILNKLSQYLELRG